MKHTGRKDKSRVGREEKKKRSWIRIGRGSRHCPKPVEAKRRPLILRQAQDERLLVLNLRQAQDERLLVLNLRQAQDENVSNLISTATLNGDDAKNR